jgi:hypothetical protein
LDRRLVTAYAIARGMLGYLRFPEQRTSWGGPFNGQRNRIAIFAELLGFYRFETVFETGTYRGTTTHFLVSSTGGIVWTVELDPWSYGFCRARFCRDRRVRPIWGDSRQALGRFTPALGRNSPTFFYLDAHWGNDLPLRDEIAAILARHADAVIMIDDFRVEGDGGYGYDDYGEGQSLSLEYIRPVIERVAPRIFFPQLPSEEETGAVRGCAVLVGRAASVPPDGFVTLREYRPSPRNEEGRVAASADIAAAR